MSDVRITKVMRGACADTDHMLLRCTLSLKLKPMLRRQAAAPKINVAMLKDAGKRRAYQDALQIFFANGCAACGTKDELTAE